MEEIEPQTVQWAKRQRCDDEAETNGGDVSDGGTLAVEGAEDSDSSYADSARHAGDKPPETLEQAEALLGP